MKATCLVEFDPKDNGEQPHLTIPTGYIQVTYPQANDQSTPTPNIDPPFSTKT